MYQTGVKSWYTGVNTLLKALNLNETNCDQAKFSFIHMYKTCWHNKLENEAVLKKGKLRTFYIFKSVFHKEVYLDVVKDRSHQQALTKLRISAHKLELENGRYSKKSMTDRLCKTCSQNKVEDESHFICDCSCYQSERYKLFDCIKQETPYFSSLSSSGKMIWLMTCENSCILKIFAKFVYTCFSLRESAK